MAAFFFMAFMAFGAAAFMGSPFTMFEEEISQVFYMSSTILSRIESPFFYPLKACYFYYFHIV